MAALLASSIDTVLRASERDDAPSSAVVSSSSVTAEPPLMLRSSVARWASIESRRLAPSDRAASPERDRECKDASVAEKLALVYALVGGTILLVYGPQEKEGGVWTMDGKSETVAGAAALALSVALFRDIRSKKP